MWSKTQGQREEVCSFWELFQSSRVKRFGHALYSFPHCSSLWQYIPFSLCLPEFLSTWMLYILTWLWTAIREGREKGREKTSLWERNFDLLPLTHVPSGDQTHNRRTCPDQQSNCHLLLYRMTPNPLNHTGQSHGWSYLESWFSSLGNIVFIVISLL